MPGVVTVQDHVGGALDQVLKGVAIARDIYGIKTAHDKAQIDQQQADQNQQKFEDEQAGVQPQSEKINALRYGKQVSEDTPGAIKMQFRGDDSPLYMLATKGSPTQQTVSDAMVGGKHGTAMYAFDPETGEPKMVNFVETAKPAKDPTPHYAVQPGLTGDDGTPLVVNTLTGKAQPLDTGGAAITNIKDKASEEKKADQAEKIYTELGKAVENPRGNKAVQQANVNLLSADNALSLANKYKGNFDQMPAGDYNLFVGELSKISSGGVPSQHTQEGIAASTLASKWAELRQKVGGNPTPADLGGFIQNNVGYLQELRNNSQKLVNNYKTAIYNSYKNRLPLELQDRFKAEHGDVFQDQTPPPQGPQGGPGQAVAAPGGSSSKPTPGSIVQVGKQQFKVGADGDTLIPLSAPSGGISQPPPGGP